MKPRVALRLEKLIADYSVTVIPIPEWILRRIREVNGCLGVLGKLSNNP